MSDQRIAKLFNYSSVEELILSFHSSTSDERLKKLDKSIVVSVFITSFLRALLWKHKSEWISSYTKTETWISESINDVEIEESLYAEVNRYVIKHYNVTEWESEEHKQSFGIVEKKTTRRTITVQVIRRIISYQSETGSYKLDAHLADSSQQE